MFRWMTQLRASERSRMVLSGCSLPLEQTTIQGLTLFAEARARFFVMGFSVVIDLALVDLPEILPDRELAQTGLAEVG